MNNKKEWNHNSSSHLVFIPQTLGFFLLTRICNGRRFLSAVAKPAVFRFPDPELSCFLSHPHANSDLSSTEWAVSETRPTFKPAQHTHAHTPTHTPMHAHTHTQGHIQTYLDRGTLACCGLRAPSTAAQRSGLRAVAGFLQLIWRGGHGIDKV